MNTGEIFRDWWKTIGTVASAISALLTFWIGGRKDRLPEEKFRWKVGGILFLVLAISLGAWRLSSLESNKANEADKEFEDHGNQPNTQNFSNSDNSKLNIGGKIDSENSGDNSRNQQSGSGKMFNGGGTDSSSTINASNYIINNYYSTNVQSTSLARPEPVPPPLSTNDQNSGITSMPNDFPGFGKPWLIRLGANSPRRGGTGYYKEFLLRVNQGDKLRVQVEPVGGASMRTQIEVLVGDKLIERPRKASTPDWTMTKGIPGESARVRIFSDVLGQLNVIVSKAD